MLGNVSSIIGLSNANVWHSHMHRVDPGEVLTPDALGAGTGPGGTYSGKDLRTLYGMPTTGTVPTGAGANIAILGAGAPNATTDVGADPGGSNYNVPTVADLDTYLGLAAGTAIANYVPTQVGVSTAADPGDPDTLGENSLDAEMVLNLAPKATVTHVFAVTNGPGLFTDGVSYVVNTLTTTHTVTVSYGSCERGSESEMPVLNALFAQALSQGQQWFFATGDNGADTCEDGTNATFSSADWPASSPYVTAVGGTEILQGGTKKKPTFTMEAWGGTITVQGQTFYAGAAGGGPAAISPSRAGRWARPSTMARAIFRTCRRSPARRTSTPSKAARTRAAWKAPAARRRCGRAFGRFSTPPTAVRPARASARLAWTSTPCCRPAASSMLPKAPTPPVRTPHRSRSVTRPPRAMTSPPASATRTSPTS